MAMLNNQMVYSQDFLGNIHCKPRRKNAEDETGLVGGDGSSPLKATGFAPFFIWKMPRYQEVSDIVIDYEYDIIDLMVIMPFIFDIRYHKICLRFFSPNAYPPLTDCLLPRSLCWTSWRRCIVAVKVMSPWGFMQLLTAWIASVYKELPSGKLR